jgi:hypothetical protein
LKAYTEYWAATMARGLLAILAGTAVLVIPEMASTILLLPFAIVISILCLAAYGVIDSAIVLTTGFMIPHERPGRVALKVQGICGVVIGILLFALVYDRIDLHWFLYLAAIQAAGIAVTEFIVARGTSVHHGARWCYASAVVAAISAIALLFGRDLSPRELAWLIYGYLGVFGFNLFTLSARMLFAERDLLRPGHRSESEGTKMMKELTK